MKVDNQQTYSRQSKPFGKSWEDWAVLWWQWCSAEPDNTNPASDRTGSHCDRNQTDPNVWFLAGTFGETVQRRCDIPRNKSLFFPIITDRISFAEHSFLKTKEQLDAYAKSDLDSTTVCEAWLDGMELENLHQNRVHTPLFIFEAPQGEFGSINKESLQAVSDGYWVFLRPLAPGEHAIRFVGQKLLYDIVYLDNIKENKPIFRVDVQYELTVT